LFAHEDDFGSPRAFAKNSLGAAFPKIATLAVGGRVAKGLQIFPLGEKIGG
jgi:hypothetical protein